MTAAAAPCLLVLDAGGTNLRALTVGLDGMPLAAAVADTPHVADAPPLGRGYDAEATWSAACRVAREVVARTRGLGAEVAGIAATGQRLACAFLDGSGGTLYVGPNTDARGVTNGWEVTEAADAVGDGLYAMTGRGLALLFAPARLLWFRDNRPEVFERVRRVVGLGDWLGHRLCGEAAVDESGAVELLALDIRTGEPLRDLWSKLGLDPAWMPSIRSAGTRAGSLTPAAAAAIGLEPGAPVAVTAPDSMAALVGSGAADPGDALVLAGSTMPVLAAAERPVADPTGRTWTGRHPVPGRGVNESNAGTTGFGWAWVAERLVGAPAGLSGDAAHALAERLAAAAPAASRGSLSLSGGACVMHATRPSSFLTRYGVALWPHAYMEPDAGVGEVARSALEGVAFAARANLEQAEEARGTGRGAVVLAGGMARSALFTQTVADVLRHDVHRPRTPEATATGAAMCAAVAAGLCGDLREATAAMTATAASAAPDPTATGPLAEAYAEWRALYDKMVSL